MRTVLFGAGSMAETVIRESSKSWNIVAIADNDSRKHGSIMGGIPVIDPREIANQQPEQIIISCSYELEARRQLITLGLAPLIVPCHVPKPPLPQPRTGIAGEELLPEVATCTDVNGSLFYDRRQAKLLGDWISSYGTIPVRSFLHIGPRYSLGVELSCAILHGWNSLSIEPYPEFPKIYKPSKHARLLKELFDLLGDRSMDPCDISFRETEQLNGFSIRLGKCRIDFKHGQLFENIDIIPEQFEFCYSNAVMEHVDDVDGFLAKSYAALRPEGLAIHQIDMRDHRNFSLPLAFLQYEDDEWEQYQSNYLNFRQNRWRYSDYLAAIDRAGFQIVKCFSESTMDSLPIDEIRSTASSVFRNRPEIDFTTLSGLFVLRKPSNIRPNDLRL